MANYSVSFSSFPPKLCGVREIKERARSVALSALSISRILWARLFCPIKKEGMFWVILKLVRELILLKKWMSRTGVSCLATILTVGSNKIWKRWPSDETWDGGPGA